MTPAAEKQIGGLSRFINPRFWLGFRNSGNRYSVLASSVLFASALAYNYNQTQNQDQSPSGAAGAEGANGIHQNPSILDSIRHSK